MMNHVSPAPTGADTTSPTTDSGGPPTVDRTVLFAGPTPVVPTPGAADDIPTPRPSVVPVTTTSDTQFDALAAPIFHHVDRVVREWTLPTLNSGFDASRDREHGTLIFRYDLPTITFTGVLLGVSTTYQPTHTCPEPHGHAPKSVRCGACRWFETRVFRLVDHDTAVLQGRRYVLHHVGRSIVPGEVNLPRYELVGGGHEVVEAYIVRKEGAVPFITKPGAKVLAQAAQFDGEIEDAYVNRATA
jgi:hypothetical protein